LRELITQIKTKEIAGDQAIFQLRECLMDVQCRFAIKLHAPQIDVLAIEQMLRERAGTGADLDHTAVSTVMGKAFNDAFCDRVLLEEMLAEMFFRTNAAHSGCTTSSKVRNATKRPPYSFCVIACNRGACPSR